MPPSGARCAVPRRTVIQSLEFVRSRRGRGGGLVRARSRPRIPAAVLLRLLTQTTKARQSRPPSPSPSLATARKEGEGRGGKGGQESCPQGGGEGERWAALAPGGAPRGSRAHERPAPSTKSCFGASGRGCAAGAGTPMPPTHPPFPPPPSMPSRAGWCAGLAPSTHLGTHVWRDWTSGATLCPRAGQAVGLTRRGLPCLGTLTPVGRRDGL